MKNRRLNQCQCLVNSLTTPTIRCRLHYTSHDRNGARATRPCTDTPSLFSQSRTLQLGKLTPVFSLLTKVDGEANAEHGMAVGNGSASRAHPTTTCTCDSSSEIASFLVKRSKRSRASAEKVTQLLCLKVYTGFFFFFFSVITKLEQKRDR